LTRHEQEQGWIPVDWSYRLPTEAEWEYACRAGTATATAFGDRLSSKEANFNGSFPYHGAEEGPDLKRTVSIGRYAPNAWGIRDMHGNVWEWCQDRYGEYETNHVVDPVGPQTGSDRVFRGGSWIFEGGNCRSAFRNGSSPSDRLNFLGFRVAAVQSGKEARDETPRPELVWLKPGVFAMGSPPDEPFRDDDETRHRVEISYRFAIGKYEVTQEEYEAVMGSNPSQFKEDGSRKPVENVSWDEAMDYCRRLTVIGHEAGWLKEDHVITLPSEAEWEYACRAGTGTATAFGNMLSSKQANFDGDIPYNGAEKGPDLSQTVEVGRNYSTNAFGIYNMHGNVAEWCYDWYGRYSQAPSVRDPHGPETGSYRVIRGGSWINEGGFCRSALRSGDDPSDRLNILGFRVAAVQSGQVPAGRRHAGPGLRGTSAPE
ncbi:MAG: formylglycine-generating enzyme family protein, partial [Verrucomicrobiota bacterium]